MSEINPHEAKTREILDHVESVVRSTVQKFLDKTADREAMGRAVDDALDSVRGHIAGPEFSWDAVDVGDGLVSLIPRNLYTGLVMADVPHEEAKAFDGLSEARLNGGRYFFNENNDFVFQHDQPIEYITITLKLKSE